MLARRFMNSEVLLKEGERNWLATDLGKKINYLIMISHSQVTCHPNRLICSPPVKGISGRQGINRSFLQLFALMLLSVLYVGRCMVLKNS